MQEPARHPTLVDHALAYAARGWNVMPLHTTRPDGACTCGRAECGSPAKHPRTAHGLKDATTDPTTIRSWWARWPEANIGLVTGADSGLLVVDVDPDHGGETSLEDLEQSYGPLPAGPRALTGGEGMHYLFSHPGGDWPNSASKLGPGLDTRGDGGYIVAPPSRHASGNRYEWLGDPDEPLPELPGWVAELLRRPTPARAPAAAPRPRPIDDTGANSRYGLRALQGEIADVRGAPEGTRNNQLFIAAANLLELANGGELDEHLVVDELRTAARDAGLPDHEIEQTIDSARARTVGAVRTAPARPERPALRAVPNTPDDDGPAPPGSDDDGEPPDDPSPAHHDNADLGNARRLITAHGHEIRWVPQWGTWLLWDGRRWARDNTGHVDRLAKRVVDAILTEAIAEPDDDKRKRQFKFALDSQRRARLEAMVVLARTEPGIPVEPHQLDADPWLLNCANGTLDLRTGGLRTADPDDLITKLAPVDHDPAAIDAVWDAFLETACGGDTELYSFLQRAVGYSLTGSTAEEVLFFVFGPAASGKSTFMDAIEATLGDYSKRADFETFLNRGQPNGIRSDIARLAGARFVNSVEVDEGAKLAEGLVKTLTGGDLITARFLYRDEFEFRPAFKLWLAANHAPRVKHGDEAMWRRILRIPFERTVPAGERDPRVKAHLRDPGAAGPAILAWAVQGCIDWQRDGLQVPESVTRSTDAYRADMDPLRDFFEDRCVFVSDTWVAGERLREEYASWARDNDVRSTLSTQAFADCLVEHGCRKETRRIDGPDGKRTQRRIWVGIGLRERDARDAGVTGDGGLFSE